MEMLASPKKAIKFLKQSLLEQWERLGKRRGISRLHQSQHAH
jgi:hypothetical protein